MKRKAVFGITFALLLIAMLTLAFNIQPVRAEPKVSVDYYGSPNIFDTNLVPGTQFSINITVDYVVNLWQWQFEMYFNPDVIQGVWYDEDLEYPVEADPDGFLASEGATVFIAPGPGWDNTLGKLWLTSAFLVMREKSVTGGGVLARVTFEVVGKGESNLTFGDNTLLFDLDGYIAPGLGHGYFRNVASGDLPTASFTWSSSPFPDPLEGQNVTFDASASTADGGTIVEYKWYFGRNFPYDIVDEIVIDTDPYISHNYTQRTLPGWVYNVTLTVKDDTGVVGSCKDYVEVKAHDIAVTEHPILWDVAEAPDNVTVGETAKINVTVTNEGDYNETGIDVTCYYQYSSGSPTLIGTVTGMSLNTTAGEREVNVTFTWNTVGLTVTDEFYTVWAKASTVDYEYDISDNTGSAIEILVKWSTLALPKVSIDYYGSPDIFDTNLVPGTQFSINITVNYVEKLWAYQLTLSFNPAVLHGVSFENGPFLGSKQGNVIVVPGEGFNNDAGTLGICGAYLDPIKRLPTGGSDEYGPLCSITFEVVGYGSSPITLGPETALINNTGHYIIHKKDDPDSFFDGYLDNISDLSVASPDINFSDANPSEGQTITISAKVHNSGEKNVKNVTVQFFDVSTPIGEEQISFISHHSHGTVSIDWTAGGEGFHLIKVVADPYNNIVETDEENNDATRSILVGEIPQFGGVVINGSATPNETRTGCPVIVQGYAEYNTTYGAGAPVAGAEVTITIEGWEQVTTHTIKDGTYKTDKRNITAPYAPGNYIIAVTVTDYTFWESIEIELNVTQEIGVDLTLSHHDISFSPPDPIENQEVNITATIHNVGTENATNVLVAFYDDGKHAENKTIDLILAGGSEDVKIPWNATPWRWHTIKVVIDPEDTIADEANEYNNEAYKNIYVYPPLPDLTPTNIEFSDSTPTVNQTIIISANVKNIGGVDASNVLVSFYDNSQPIGNTTIPWIPGKHESRTASITYNFSSSGSHLVCVKVDPSNDISESAVDNNQYCRSILVHLPSIDLTLSSSDITFSSSTPTIGEVITIYATIHNIGEEDAENVSVEFFDCMTICTRIASPITIPLILAGGQETVDVSWDATPVGWHPIKVVIDGNNTIAESDENNNNANRYLYVYPEVAADLCIYSEDIVFSNTNPDPGESVTIYATVHNIGEAEAQDVTVRFYINNVQLGSPKTISSISVGGDEIASTNWIASQIGSHVVKAMVDTEIESNKDNNVATRAICVGAGAGVPEFPIGPALEILFIPVIIYILFRSKQGKINRTTKA